MANPTNTPAAQPAKFLVDCPKCDGKGRIRGFDHVCGGVCFECEGARKVLVDEMTAAEINQAKVSNLFHSADVVLEAADLGNDDRAEFYMACMVKDMLAVGTTAAREVLEYLRQGRYENYNLMVEGRCDQATAARLRARLIEMGREAKAQEDEQNIDSADHERAA